MKMEMEAKTGYNIYEYEIDHTGETSSISVSNGSGIYNTINRLIMPQQLLMLMLTD